MTVKFQQTQMILYIYRRFEDDKFKEGECIMVNENCIWIPDELNDNFISHENGVYRRIIYLICM